MGQMTAWYQGGFVSGAPAQNRSEQWSNATQPSDPTPAGYTAWNANGTVKTQRALTAQESAQLAAQDTAATQSGNDTATQTALNTALTRLTQIMNQGNTLAVQQTVWTVNQQQAVAQAVADMALIQRRLIRRALNLFDASN